MTYKLGSLFDGSGGFPLAGSLCGIEPAWASEVEPYPIAVTRSRFPNMKHLGDISKINGAEVEPVDIITFGSPCQDLSVAGKRAGLKHEANGDEETTRSGLFMEAVRIIREMKEATHGRFPSYALWENVPGAFSSNGGEDFRIVLEELIKIVEPSAVMPAVPKNGWPYADSYCGDGWSLAYRVFDAQYWGVPQRRRRIHLVLDLRGERAQEVLFERKGVRGYFAEGRTPWQAAASHAENGTGADDREGAVPVTLEPGIAAREGGHIYEGVSGTLRAEAGDNRMAVAHMVLDDQGGSSINVRTDGKAPTLRAETHGNLPCVMESAGFCPEQSAKTRGIGYEDEVAPTLRAGVTPGICVKTYDARGNGDGDTVSTLTGDHENRITDYTSVVVEKQPVYCLQGNGIDRADTAGCNGKGWKEDVGYTLNTIDRPAVAYGVETFHCNTEEEKVPTLKARDWKDPHVVVFPEITVRYIVRRLTPTECARLQGFADRWGDIDPKTEFSDAEYRFWLEVRNTHATVIGGREAKEYTKEQMLKWYNGLQTDSSEYKLWGNGIALPPALYCLQGIADALEAEKTTECHKRDELGRFAFKDEPVLCNGYPVVYDPEHPRAKSNGYVREHILVAEQMLGRPLKDGEVIHHINEDKTDNRPENIMVFDSQSDHMKHHWELRHAQKEVETPVEEPVVEEPTPAVDPEKEQMRNMLLDVAKVFGEMAQHILEVCK